MEKDKLLKLGIREKIDFSEKIIKDAIERFGFEKIAIAWQLYINLKVKAVWIGK